MICLNINALLKQMNLAASELTLYCLPVSHRYLFSALSFFNWVCWIAPTNSTVNTLFGYTSGLGMSILTFDWAQIAYNLSPLATPWWAQANVLAGFGQFISLSLVTF